MYNTTEKQELFRDTVREFAQEEIHPIAYQLDLGNDFPYEAIRKFGKAGYMGIPYPREMGGKGLDFLSYILAVEELARVDAGTAVTISAHSSLACHPLYRYGTTEQQLKYLFPMLRGKKLGAFALSEVNAGSDAAGIVTTATKHKDHYLLNGSKVFVTNAPMADVYILFAVTTPDVGTKGISAFILEKTGKASALAATMIKWGFAPPPPQS